MVKRVSKRSRTTKHHKTLARDAFPREARQLQALKKTFKKSARLTLQTMLKMGKVLLRVKVGFGPRGGFNKWTRAHFGSEDEASDFMICVEFAAEYADRYPGNFRTISLSVAAFVAIARSKLPREIVENILDRSRAGEHFTGKKLETLARQNRDASIPGYTLPSTAKDKNLSLNAKPESSREYAVSLDAPCYRGRRGQDPEDDPEPEEPSDPPLDDPAVNRILDHIAAVRHEVIAVQSKSEIAVAKILWDAAEEFVDFADHLDPVGKLQRLATERRLPGADDDDDDDGGGDDDDDDDDGGGKGSSPKSGASNETGARR